MTRMRKATQHAVRQERRTPLADRLDGEFLILTVDSGGVDGGFRLRVRRSGTDQELSVQVPQGALSDEQIEILQSGEWGKTPLSMQLNIKSIDDTIIDARLVNAGIQQASGYDSASP
jgi:hypothetical protein